MTPGSISLRQLGKAYRQYSTEWDRVLSWFGIPTRAKSESWVLRDISFDMQPGEAVGIIGQNGSGKSTLLKIISGALEPTAGQVSRGGRIAAILELGLGFNPEFTGRENALNYLRMVGIPEMQIVELMHEVEAFAEIGKYFDSPMRIYSSGMQMRVAFAAATTLRPDLLIIDEALAVGDSYFVHKCIARIRAYCLSGTTLLFVSHDPGAVRQLCRRAVLLDNGEMIRDGPSDEVVDYYNALLAAKENAKLSVEQRRERGGWLTTTSGTGEAMIRSLRLVDAAAGHDIQMAEVGQRLRLIAEVTVHVDIPALVIGYMLKDRLGHVVWGTNTWHTQQRLLSLRAGQTVTFSLNFVCTLGPGSYAFSPALVSTDTHLVNNYQWTDNALVLDVVNTKHGYFIGSNALDYKFDVLVS